MKLIFVRHGETQFNRDKILQGQNDVPLTANGRNQALIRGRLLLANGYHFSAIFSSDLERAFETATIIAKTLNFSGVIHTSALLREMNLGILVGQSTDLSSSAKKMLDKAWTDYFYVIPEGESVNEFIARLQVFCINFIQPMNAHDSYLIVTHGGCICSFLKDIFKVITDINEWSSTNCCLSELINESNSSIWKLIKLNENI